ncbi:MAG: polyprenyl synthetase family protein [Actinomycetota bacterium]|nr:polyprenyl synthetase family protein [Actinomycetota bacterium]
MTALQVLADQLRSEDTPISPHVIDPTDRPELGELTGSPEYALVIEAVREGYLLHYEQPRLLAGHDPDLALLAGDYLYALGLDRLATLGDTRAVVILSDLISDCARLHAEYRPDEVPALWRTAAEQIAAGSR